MIELSKIRIDGGTQPRAEIDQATVAEYAESYKSCAYMPPIMLFYDGVEYWLADGFHRYHGARLAGLKSIYEDITPGTRRDAILFSLSANSKHGLKRSNADKRKAVKTLLDDPEWSKWSNEKIAATCAVSPHTVADVKKAHSANAELEIKNAHSANAELESVTYTTKHGTTATMRTGNVGKRDPVGAASSTATNPAEDEPPEYTPLDEANDTISELQTELALAKSGVAVADNDKDSVTLLISSLRDEIRMLKAKLAAVTAARDQYQTENGELKKQILRNRREIDKITGSRTS